MNTCDQEIGCHTQKHEACKDTRNPAVKFGKSRNGTSITWILVNMGSPPYCKISEYGWMNTPRNRIGGPFCSVMGAPDPACVDAVAGGMPMIREPRARSSDHTIVLSRGGNFAPEFRISSVVRLSGHHPYVNAHVTLYVCCKWFSIE